MDCTVVVWLLPMLPACTENDAPVVPPGTVTDAGIVSDAWLVSAIRTMDPALGAAPDSVTVQVDDVFELSTVGLQASAVIVAGAGGAGGGAGGGGASWSAKSCELPFSDATIVGVVAALTAAALALNCAVTAPRPIATEPGMLKAELLPETPRLTLNPPPGAGADDVTLHSAVPGVVSGFGEQASAVKDTGGVMVTVPAPPVIASVLPAASVAEGLAIWTAEEVSAVVDETVNVIVAITPVPIEFSFRPKSRQLIDPVPGLQEIDLPAELAAGPAATLMEVKSPVE